MVISDQIAEAKVVDVVWSPSKSGYLKPRVRIEPIKLGGVTIEYATGFNGKFIQDNKIGIGAIIQIIRSGDVIPYIKSITAPAEVTKMPTDKYHWTDTNVDIVIDNVDVNETVQLKNITDFFKGLEVDGIGIGNVKKIMKAGYTSVPAILKMTKEDFQKVEGFKTKTLIKEGPYSMVRNPLYVFSLMIFIGLCLAIKSIPISIALITIFTLFHIPTILNEEKILLNTHDESYREYYKSTPRLFPNIFKYRKPKSTDRIEVKIQRINKRLWEVIGYLVLFVIIDGYWISSLL